MAPRHLHRMNKSQINNPIICTEKNMKKLKALLLSVSLLASSSFAYAEDYEYSITDIIVTPTTIQVTPVITPDNYKLNHIEYYLDGKSEYRYDLQPFTFTGLERNKNYEIWVCFDLEEDYYEYSQVITTSGANPKLNVTVTNVKENQIALSYYVTDCPADKNVNWYQFYVDDVKEALEGFRSSSTTIDYEDINTNPKRPLQPGKKYTIRAEALEREDETPICTWTQEITTAEGTYTVFYDNSESQWSEVSLYAWNDGGSKNAEWPGVAISQLSEGSNIWIAQVSKDFPKIIFNNNGHEEQTANLAGVEGRTYHKDSKSIPVSIAGAFNGWNTTANTSDDVNGTNATVIVSNYTNSAEGFNEGFKVVTNNSNWYGGNGNPKIGTWFDNMGGNNMLLKTADGSENYEGGVKFTVDYNNGHFLAEELDPTVTNIEWVGLTQDEEGNSELNLYTDKANAPIMAYACNAAGDRLPYDVTFAISEEEPNGLGSMFVNTDKVVDGRGLVIPEGAEGNKYEYTLSAVVNFPTSLSLPKQHRAAPAISNKDVKVNFNNQKTPTAIETISIDNTSDTSDDTASDGPIRWYNLSGLEIPAPTAGSVCIKVQGSKAEKIFIR